MKSFGKLTGLIFFSMVIQWVSPASSPAFWPEQWYLRTATLKGIVYGTDKWVAVGASGNILTSTDRIHWEKQNTPSSQNLNRITYVGSLGLYVAVGENGTILTSPDGNSWTQRTSNTDSSLYGIAYGNGRFVAVGSTGTIVTSTDGISWTKLSSITIEILYDVTYAMPNGFVAVGSRTAVLYSQLGLSWNKTTPGCTQTSTQDFRAVAAGNGYFVTVGEGICYSTDGQSWHPESLMGQPPLRNLYDVAYESSRFIAVGNSGEILTSNMTATDWISQPSNTNNELFGIAYDVTSKGLLAVGNGGIVVASDNGNDWVRQNVDLLCIDYKNGRFVAVGTWGTIRTSLDGINWQTQTSNTSWALRGITFGKNQFVIAGDGGTILTSPDGNTWTPQNLTTGDWLFGITYGGNGKFVAVGISDKIYYSSNGSFWQSKPLTTTYALNGITYGNGRFVTVGVSSALSGAILASSDGEIWGPQPPGTSEWLFGVAYGNGLFVVVGSKGTILTSPDGQFWTPLPDAQKIYFWDILAITYKYGRFVAVTATGAILTSLDGTNWSLKKTWEMAGSTKDPLRSVVGGRNSFMTVGDGGIILESEESDFPIYLPLIRR
jgi:photosystem II stability/assembly factor-like uncharacterized protein